MAANAPARPSAGRSVLAFATGVLLGIVLLVPGWTGSLDVLPSGEFGVVVAFAAVGLLAFTLVMWLVVVVFVLT